MFYDTCKYWNRRLKNDDFDLSDRERPGQLPKFEDGELQELISRTNPYCGDVHKKFSIAPVRVSRYRLAIIGAVMAIMNI